jgi:hypothetical protein
MLFQLSALPKGRVKMIYNSFKVCSWDVYINIHKNNILSLTIYMFLIWHLNIKTIKAASFNKAAFILAGSF